MMSQSITSKQILSFLERNQSLCEASPEYPSLKHLPTPRHLGTSLKTSKTPESTIIHKLANQMTTEHHEKDSNKYSKTSREEIELIELFPDEGISNKLYKTRRYQSTRRNDDEQMDSTN